MSLKDKISRQVYFEKLVGNACKHKVVSLFTRIKFLVFIVVLFVTNYSRKQKEWFMVGLSRIHRTLKTKAFYAKMKTN